MIFTQSGTKSYIASDLSTDTIAGTGEISGMLSTALLKAWKSKTKEKTKWTAQCDINAPALVIPENCSAPEANVLVFDLGRLKVDYGKNEVEPTVKSWFDEQPKPGKCDGIIDSGSLGISKLMFVIRRAGDLRLEMDSKMVSEVRDDAAKSTIIEPLSASLDFGVQSYADRDTPSLSAHASIPTVSLSISPSQISKVLSVYMGWEVVISEFTNRTSNDKKYEKRDGQREGDTIGAVPTPKKGHKADSSVRVDYIGTRI